MTFNLRVTFSKGHTQRKGHQQDMYKSEVNNESDGLRIAQQLDRV